MKTFAITGTFEGAVYLTYNEEGVLCCLDMLKAKLNVKQMDYFRINVAGREDELPALLTKAKLQAIEVVSRVTFEDFYREYGVKEGKKKAESSWSKLPEAEQMKAYMYIGKLKAKKGQTGGEAMPYPATYLNQQRWND